MARTARKGLSKKTRFDVFKRDGFRCAYCGETPPKVILHVDHILAVASGGTNHRDNLVTSCSDCNLGKGARDLSVVPQPLKDKRAEMREREEQLREYQALLSEKHTRLERETWDAIRSLEHQEIESFPMDRFLSVKRFVEQIGFYEVLEATEIARVRFPHYKSDYSRFKYFCGVCWRKIKGPANACA